MHFFKIVIKKRKTANHHESSFLASTPALMRSLSIWMRHYFERELHLVCSLSSTSSGAVILLGTRTSSVTNSFNADYFMSPFHTETTSTSVKVTLSVWTLTLSIFQYIYILKRHRFGTKGVKPLEYLFYVALPSSRLSRKRDGPHATSLMALMSSLSIFVKQFWTRNVQRQQHLVRFIIKKSINKGHPMPFCLNANSFNFSPLLPNAETLWTKNCWNA